MFYENIPPIGSRAKSVPVLTALCAAFIVSAPVALASDPGDPQVIFTGDQLTGTGSSWYPDIPASAWTVLTVAAPPATQYANLGGAIDDVTVSVTTAEATGLVFPKNYAPEVVYDVTGSDTSIDQPLIIDWPNVNGYLPDDAHLVFAYDPQTADWNVCGIAIVSADGATLTQPDNANNTTLSYYFIAEDPLPAYPGR